MESARNCFPREWISSPVKGVGCMKAFKEEPAEQQGKCNVRCDGGVACPSMGVDGLLMCDKFHAVPGNVWSE